MKVLVTGGAGYIGAHLVKKLNENGARCYVIDNLSRGLTERISTKASFEKIDLCDYKITSKFMKKKHFDAIFHLAGYMQARESSAIPQEYKRNNVEATKNLLDSVSSPERTKFIFSSSCSVYGNNPQATESSAINPLSVYAQTKVDSEVLIKKYFSRVSKNFVILRFFNVIGCLPQKFFCDIQKETLLPATARRILGGIQPLIYGNTFDTFDNFAIRDYIDVRDVVSALILPLDQSLSGIHNLSAQQTLSTKQVLTALLKISKKEHLGFEIGAQNPEDPAVIGSLPSPKLQSLGWSAQFNVEQSIHDFWVTFKSYFPLEQSATNRH
jgi:UDP-glucose 4-epimerase